MSSEIFMTENKDIEKKNNNSLTERNWLMLKSIEKGNTVQEAYREAGYQGDYNAAYQMYWKLKKKLELVYDSNNTDSLRLKIEAKKILDMPMKDDKIKPEVKLKAIETLYKLSGQEKQEKRTISPFIVFKSDGKDSKADSVKIIEPIEVEDLRDKEDSEVAEE